MTLVDPTLALDTDKYDFYPDGVFDTCVFPVPGGIPNPPRILHMQNVVPTKRGFRNAARKTYTSSTPPATPSPYKSNRLMFVTAADGTSGWYFAAGVGTLSHYVYDVDSAVWRTPGTVADANATRKITQARVNGVDYVFNSVQGILSFTANFAAVSVLSVNGITATSMQGICNALDYLICWDTTTIYWSAPGDETEFRVTVSSVATGAGSSALQALTGLIVECRPIPNGFLIYTTEEVIAARYSQNSSNPWIFTKVQGAGGISEFQNLIGVGSSAGSHLVYTKSGLQDISMTKAEQIFPELASFMASLYSVASAGNNKFTNTEISPAKKLVQVALVSNRYLCVGYSNTGFATPTLCQGIWVYDILLRKFGHIVVSHLGIFDYYDPLADNDDRVGMLGVWNANGSIDLYRLSPDGRSVTGDTQLTGEIVLGDHRLTLTSRCQVNKVTLNGDIDAAFNPTVTVLGRDKSGWRSANVTFTQSPANRNEYLGDVDAMSHRIRISGSFDLSSVNIQTVAGNRI